MTVKAELARSSGEPTSLEGTWALDEGAIHLNAAILPDLFVPDHQLNLVLDGSVPRWSPEADVASIASDWSGAWSIRTASEQAGLDTEDGQIDVTVQRTEPALVCGFRCPRALRTLGPQSAIGPVRRPDVLRSTHLG